MARIRLVAAMESALRPRLAVIIKGNPKYIEKPIVELMANSFYNGIKVMLERKGFRVTFDAGEPFSTPDESAYVWIAHSRGIDRLRFAPSHIKTIALQTEDHKKNYKNTQQDRDRSGVDPDHYILSDQDIRAINAL